MATTRNIKHRIKATKNIRAVTRTVEMVASARYRQARGQVAAARPHTDRLVDLVGDIMARRGAEQFDHPLLHEPEDINREVLMVVTSDRGLCGGYNQSVLRVAIQRREQLIEAGYEVLLWVSGRRGAQYLARHGLEIDWASSDVTHLPGYLQIGRLGDQLMADFLDRRIGGLEVAYMQFISASRQEPAISQILPMAYIEPPARFVTARQEPVEYQFMPTAEEVLRHLLPATVRLRLWQCFLDAGLCEQAVRIVSMRAATENADEMIHDLTVSYNHKRQSGITAELAEIMSGSAATE